MRPQIARILCPVDFSDPSVHAVEQAIVFAAWYKARVTALHVYTPMFVPVPMLPPPADRVPEPELSRVREQLERCVRHAKTVGVSADVLVSAGHPAREILESAARIGADLIVMGTHGASGFEHLVLGSVTERVLRKATCPVLTVPPRARATSRLPFERVMCGVDFSEWSLAALDLASSIAQESGAGLLMVHVVEWPWPEPPPPRFEELPAERAAALREYRRDVEKSAAARLEALVPGPVADRCTTMVVNGKSYVEILRVAAAERADLLVLGVHGRNALDVALFGSTTNQVVRRATCPVLTLRR